MIDVRGYATISGKRLFLVPNIMSRDGRKLSVDSFRRSPVVLRSAYTDIDTIELELPKGFRAESTPRPSSIESPFGSYFSEVKLDGDRLTYYRKIVQHEGSYPPESYKDLVSFQEAVYKADRARLVLVKQAEEPAKKAFE